MIACLLALAITVTATTSPATSTATPATQPTLDSQYMDLLRMAESYNGNNPNMDGWLMNLEHCFLVPASDNPAELLQDRVIKFVREPGALDFLFDRLLDRRLADEEVLVDAQFLIFAGEYYVRNDDVIAGGKRARELVKAAESGRFLAAERHYPQAPIREKILIAAKRALKNN